MRRATLVCSAFLLLLIQTALASPAMQSNSKKVSEEVPPIVIAGMEAYKSRGPDEAVRAWIKGSPVEGSKEALSQANNLRQVQDFYGAYQTFDLISVRDLTPSIRVLYLALNFEKGPLFAKFIVFKAGSDWILTSFAFNTSDTAVLPTPPMK